MAGRKPKPTAAKKLAGNPGKRALNRAEPRMPELKRTPAPPSFLGKPAKKEWKRVAPLLMTARVLTSGDLAALEAYCVQYGVMVEAQEQIKKDGMMVPDAKGILSIHPMFAAQQQALSQMRQFMVEFGLTPSSRSRIQVPPAETKDEFGDFLHGK
ncbi:MAG: phage terminase small subunit P27 family [Thermodesulfobacteriota bacterium]